MKAFKNYNADERRAFVFAFIAAAQEAPYVWALPWGYAPDWMVDDAGSPEEAACRWRESWADEIAARLNPVTMEVFREAN